MVNVYESPPTSNLLIWLLCATWVINWLKQSITRLKREGDRVSLTVILRSKHFPLGHPWIIMEKFLNEIQPLIQFLHLIPNPLTSRISSRKSQSTLSKAFSISSFMTIPSFFLQFINGFICHWRSIDNLSTHYKGQLAFTNGIRKNFFEPHQQYYSNDVVHVSSIIKDT